MSDVDQLKSVLWSVVAAAELYPDWQRQDYLLERAAEGLARYIELKLAEKTGKPYEIPSGVK